jgi:iron complex outermembrane receptor protein
VRNSKDVDTQNQTSSQIRQLSEIELPVTNAQLLVQSPTPSNPPVVEGSIVTITGVKANPTDKGVEVILETTLGEQLQVTNRSAENNFIADIPNAQLRLPSGEAFTFRSEKPVEGITEITVTNVDANTVRVAVVGVAALPTVELFDDDAGLVFGVASTATATQPPETPPTEEQPTEEQPPSETPAAQQDEPIELVVTGEQDSYRVPNASTATRTDTPLRDIPQSIQVVPRQVLEERQPRTLTEAVETVSGVVPGGSLPGSVGRTIIRGFSQEGNFRNGFRDVDRFGITGIGTIEQVEVLKGPASVLFGALEPGGIVNVITRQPLSEPYYNFAFEAGNYGFYQPSIDLSGPLTADNTLLYRFIASYQGADSFQDFVNSQQTTIAPSITLNLGDRTSLNLYYEYISTLQAPTLSGSAVLSDGSLTPRNLYIGYPDISRYDVITQRYGYTLNHEFNDNWQIRNNFSVADVNTRERVDVDVINIIDDRFVEFESYDGGYTRENYFGQIDLVGKFNTGSISHQLIVGFDYNRFVTEDGQGFFSNNFPSLDILNPNYNIPRPEYEVLSAGNLGITQSYGVYLQDQIAFSDNLKLLIGGRYDWISSERTDFGSGTVSSQNDDAFSPRLGLVYQPSDTVSLYSSYSRSFLQTGGSNPDGRQFLPTRGTQYEVGVKADFLDSKLSANLAAYQITKTNVTTSDPDRPRFSIQTGEQQSQGIELDVTGEISPGWNVIASYAYTDAKVTADNRFPIGSRLYGVPNHQASLWTTYTIQGGDLKGLGFGLGLFYVGERQGSGNLADPFILDPYLRTDAAIYYRRDRLKAAINIRNLFDIDYSSFALGNTYLVRDAPFTITGSVSWEILINFSVNYRLNHVPQHSVNF